MRRWLKISGLVGSRLPELSSFSTRARQFLSSERGSFIARSVQTLRIVASSASCGSFGHFLRNSESCPNHRPLGELFSSDVFLRDADLAQCSRKWGWFVVRAIDSESNAAQRESKFYRMAWETGA